jgi:hypothetical protein
MNEPFTQVVESARPVGLGKLEHVAVDSTRVAASAAADSVNTVEKLRAERSKIRRRIRHRQQQYEADDVKHAGGKPSGTGGAPEAGAAAGRDSAASGGARESRNAAAVAHGCRESHSARPPRIHAGLHGPCGAT